MWKHALCLCVLVCVCLNSVNCTVSWCDGVMFCFVWFVDQIQLPCIVKKNKFMLEWCVKWLININDCTVFTVIIFIFVFFSLSLSLSELRSLHRWRWIRYFNRRVKIPGEIVRRSVCVCLCVCLCSLYPETSYIQYICHWTLSFHLCVNIYWQSTLIIGQSHDSLLQAARTKERKACDADLCHLSFAIGCGVDKKKQSWG